MDYVISYFGAVSTNGADKNPTEETQKGQTAKANTIAIQAAIDAAAANGGGRVVVPPGCYLTGSVF